MPAGMGYPEQNPRAAAMGRQMEQEMPAEPMPEEAPAAQAIPLEEVMAAMEQLRPQAADAAKFDQALSLLAEALGGGQAAEQAPTPSEGEEIPL